MRNGHKQFIEELGETGLVERIAKRFKASSEAVRVGAGEDDCAVMDLESASAGYRYLVVTTDTVQRSTHFPRGISPFQMGWSAVAVNLSDIAAMGAHPFAFVIAMGIPGHTDTDFLDALIAGIKACASAYNVVVVGGDVTRSKELVLTGTCFGFVNKPVKRSTARVGDLLGVTGRLGNAAVGLKMIEEGIRFSEEIEAAAKRALFQPIPRVNEGIILAESGMVTSMIDISDGLALSLAELGRRSHVGFELYKEEVPVSSAEVPLELAIYYGGDYELLFTLDAGISESELKRLRKEVDMSIIGRVMPQEAGIYFREGSRMEAIAIKGYQHF